MDSVGVKSSPAVGRMESQPLKVLIVEDNRDDAELINHLLCRKTCDSKYTIRIANTLKAALDTLASDTPHVILCDLDLPDSRGLDSLDQIIQFKQNTAIVVLTGMADQEAAIRAMQAGAQDYLIKGEFSGALLERTIRYAIERARIVANERQLLEGTLNGSIKALTSILSLANPAAFGRANRLK